MLQSTCKVSVKHGDVCIEMQRVVRCHTAEQPTKNQTVVLVD